MLISSSTTFLFIYLIYFFHFTHLHIFMFYFDENKCVFNLNCNNKKITYHTVWPYLLGNFNIFVQTRFFLIFFSIFKNCVHKSKANVNFLF